MDSPLPQEPGGLPPAYADPEAYLLQARFHHSLKYRPEYLVPEDEPLRVTYALVGNDKNPDAPCVVWQNGMGGSRLSGLIFDGLFASKGVRLLCIDRPSAGGSTPVPIRHRLAASHDALRAILAHHSITSIHIMSHSNGIIYTVYTLLRLLTPLPAPLPPADGSATPPSPASAPPPLRVLSWRMTSPWVPPWHSGQRALNAARWLPAYATGSLGSVLSGLQAVTGSLSDWRATLPKTVPGLSGWWATPAGPPQGEAVDPPRELTPQEDLDAWTERNANRALHYRGFGRAFFPARATDIVTSWVLEEGLAAYGDEALISLRKGVGTSWGWGQDPETGVEDESTLYANGFAALKAALAGRGTDASHFRMSVAYAELDALIPQQGREFLRSLLVDQLELVEHSDWLTVEGAGHDDLLAREIAIKPIADRARATG